MTVAAPSPCRDGCGDGRPGPGARAARGTCRHQPRGSLAAAWIRRRRRGRRNAVVGSAGSSARQGAIASPWTRRPCGCSSPGQAKAQPQNRSCQPRCSPHGRCAPTTTPSDRHEGLPEPLRNVVRGGRLERLRQSAVRAQLQAAPLGTGGQVLAAPRQQPGLRLYTGNPCATTTSASRGAYASATR